MALNKPLEMCKNAICITNARGCFKLFVKSMLYSTIILCGSGDQKSIKLDGRDFISAAAQKRHRRPGGIFLRLIFRQRTKFGGGGGQIWRLRGLLDPHLTQCRLGQGSRSIQPFGDNRYGPKIGGGLCPLLLGGSWVLSNTMRPGPRLTFVPNGILLRPASWPQ